MIGIIINAVIPFLAYIILSNIIKPDLALLIVAVIPLLLILYSAVRFHRINRISIIILIVFGVCGTIALITGNEKWLLVKSSLVTGSLGVVLLVTSVINRPLIVYLLNLINKRRGIDTNDNNDDVKKIRILKIANFSLSLILIADALLHLYLVFNLSTASFLAISPMFKAITIGICVLLLVVIRRFLKR